MLKEHANEEARKVINIIVQEVRSREMDLTARETKKYIRETVETTLNFFDKSGDRFVVFYAENDESKETLHVLKVPNKDGERINFTIKLKE